MLTQQTCKFVLTFMEGCLLKNWGHVETRTGSIRVNVQWR